MKTLITTLILFTSLTAFSKEEIKVNVKGLVCSLCEESLESKLKKTSDVSKVEVNLDKFWIKIITTSSNKLQDKDVKKILEESGYLLDSIERKQCVSC